MLNLSFEDAGAILPQGFTTDGWQGVNPHGETDHPDYRRDGFHPAAPDRYQPTWKFVAPPGVGDAPQHVYSTFALIPFDARGPGDNPVTYLRSVNPLQFQNFTIRQNGMPVAGGSLLLTGLYTPSPQNSPANAPY
jgi:hypothetical protein